MGREVRIGDAVLYCGDCRDILDDKDIDGNLRCPICKGAGTIEDGTYMWGEIKTNVCEYCGGLGGIKVDCCITDPPYGDATHDGAMTSINEKLITFDSISEDDLIDIFKKTVSITKRWTISFCEWKYMLRIEKELPFIRFGIWVKPNGAPQFTGDRPATGWEAIAILHSPGKKIWNGGGNHAVWSCNKENGGHPTQKPLPLIIKLLELFSNKDELILDPFMGSGTTGVGCAKLGRKFIGIEIEPKYFEIACERIQKEYDQMKLW